MADLIGSILSSMQKPPEKSEKEKKDLRERKRKMAKMQEETRKHKEKFQAEIDEKVSNFVKDSNQKRYQFEPMDKLHRTVVYDIAETAGLISQAFGRDDAGERYIMLFKKDFPPSEAEMAAYRNGETWSEEQEIEEIKRLELLKESRKLAAAAASEQKRTSKRKPPQHSKCPNDVEPAGNYKEKYHHIIGSLAAKDAAQITKANASFGMVPSKNKRDLRSIEETLKDISAKKRKKQQERQEQEGDC